MIKYQKSKIKTILFALLSLIALFIVNKDLYQYRFICPYKREFSKENSTKGFKSIYDGVTLKPADYQVIYEGESQGKENVLCIQDTDGNILADLQIQEGPFQESVALKIEGSAKQLRLGVIYNGGESRLRIEQITITSSHVLYRDSLLRHLTISFGILILCALLILRFNFQKIWENHVPEVFCGENELILLFLLLMALLSCYPLLIPNTYLQSDDSLFHLSRIEGIAEAIRAGEFPARIHLFFIQNYGYGNGFFYPQIWLYIPVLFRLLGFPVMTTYTIFMILCSCISTIFTYGCTKHISGKKSSGIIAGLLSCFASYRLIDGFFRGALGEVQAFIFLPLIIWAVYDIFCLKKDNWLLLFAGFMGLLGSHLISLAITGIVFLLFLLGNLCTGKVEKHELTSVIKAGVLTVLMGAFFFLPFLEQSNHTDLAVNILVSSKSGSVTQSNVLPWTSIFNIFTPWRNASGHPHPWLGIPLLCVFIFLIIPVRNSSYAVKTARVLGLLSLLTLWASTDLFPWEIFSWLFNRIQFSWRFLLIPTACLPIAGGIIMPEVLYFISDKILVVIICMITLFFAEMILNETVNQYIITTPQFILQNNRIIGGEYLPQKLNKEYADKNRDTVKYAGEVLNICNQNRHGLSFTFDFTLDALQENAVMEIPLAFYYGYQADFCMEDGTILQMVVEEGPNGLTAVRDLPATSGTICVYYQKTSIQRVSEIISLLTLVALATWIIVQRRRKQPLAPSWA